MTVTIVSVIVGLIAFLVYGWLGAKQSQVVAVEGKNKALEDAAQKERDQDEAEDEEEAREVATTGDTKRAIGFLRDSFGKTRGKV